MSLPLHKVRLWDLPLRLFHWALPGLIGFSWWSAHQGSDWMDAHARAGIAMLTLLLFRFGWGIVGSDSARFAGFVRGPRATLTYLRARLRGNAIDPLGHNPLGAWMIIALLGVLLFQTLTGLFGTDDIDFRAPLAHWLSGTASSYATALHALGFELLLILSGVHLLAVAMHQITRRDGLISAMVSGNKRIAFPTAAPAMASNWRALGVLIVAAAVVAGILGLAAVTA